MKRRTFIKTGVGAGIAIGMPFFSNAEKSLNTKPIKIGIVADVHQDVIFDGYARLKYFIDEMKEQKPDFIIQLGDFALPRPQNQIFLDTWNEFEGEKYHVLGNHDMRDYGFTREQTMKWWGMEKPYYSFDKGGVHFVVLDGNDENPKPWSGYNRFINQSQQDWLKADLRSTEKPTIVFVHQSIENEEGVVNGADVRKLMESERLADGSPKVKACFSGHHHTDYHKKINSIYHIQINSMSYKWVGSEYQRVRFGKHLETSYPHLKSICPYKDPLFTVLTVDIENSEFNLQGATTSFISPTPFEIGHPSAKDMHPTITSGTFKI